MISDLEYLRDSTSFINEDTRCVILSFTAYLRGEDLWADFLVLFEIGVSGVVKPSLAQANLFRPNSFETTREMVIMALDVARTLIILFIVCYFGFQRSRDVYRKKCKSASQELIRLSIALFMFAFTLMDVLESYRLIMSTHELYKTKFKVGARVVTAQDTSRMAKSFKWSIYWEGF